MFILILTFILTAFLYVKIYLHRKRLMRYVQHLPTSNELPLIGCAHNFLGKDSTGNEHLII